MPYPKPERRRYVKNREKRAKTLTRRQAVELVYRREHMRCERCTVLTIRPSKCYWEGEPRMAQVNERVPRSLGGSPVDLANLELTCQACHQPNGEHAPTAERQQRLAELRKR